VLAPAAHLDPELDRLAEALLVLVAGPILHLHRRGVELLEDPRHRRQVGGLGLDDLLKDLLRVPAGEDDRSSHVEGGQLDREREHVRQRQV
jgi:hypothetical protein